MCTSSILVSWLLEYLYVVLSSGTFIFDMIDITISIPSPAPGPSAYIGVGLGVTTSPYIDHSFESVHIPPSTPFTEDFHSLRLFLIPVFIPMGVVVDT